MFSLSNGSRGGLFDATRHLNPVTSVPATDVIESDAFDRGWDGGREFGYQQGRAESDLEMYRQGRLAGHGDLARELVALLADESYDHEAGLTGIITDLMKTRETFTRSQVAYLLSLAFESGSRTRHREDLAEIVVGAPWAEDPREMYRKRVAERRAEIDRLAAEPKTPVAVSPALLDCDWPAVAVPGMGVAA